MPLRKSLLFASLIVESGTTVVAVYVAPAKVSVGGGAKTSAKKETASRSV